MTNAQRAALYAMYRLRYDGNRAVRPRSVQKRTVEALMQAGYLQLTANTPGMLRGFLLKPKAFELAKTCGWTTP